MYSPYKNNQNSKNKFKVLNSLSLSLFSVSLKSGENEHGNAPQHPRSSRTTQAHHGNEVHQQGI